MVLGSNASRSKRFSLLKNCPDWLCDPPAFHSMGTRALSREYGG